MDTEGWCWNVCTRPIDWKFNKIQESRRAWTNTGAYSCLSSSLILRHRTATCLCTFVNCCENKTVVNQSEAGGKRNIVSAHWLDSFRVSSESCLSTDLKASQDVESGGSIRQEEEFELALRRKNGCFILQNSSSGGNIYSCCTADMK